MKRRTYNNIMKTAKYFQRVKHYDEKESIDLAMRHWDEYNLNCGRPIEVFLEQVLTKEEWLAQ